MCTDDDRAPGSVAEALRMAHAGLDYLNSPAAADVDAAACGPVLAALGELQAKATAAHATLLRRFDALDGHDADGYGTSAARPAAMAKLARRDARAAVRRMRRLGERPHLADAPARGELSWSWAGEVIGWLRRLPAGLRAGTEKILADPATAAEAATAEATTATTTAETTAETTAPATADWPDVTRSGHSEPFGVGVLQG
jgi:hypothetical protein